MIVEAQACLSGLWQSHIWLEQMGDGITNIPCSRVGNMTAALFFLHVAIVGKAIDWALHFQPSNIHLHKLPPEDNHIVGGVEGKQMFGIVMAPHQTDLLLHLREFPLSVMDLAMNLHSHSPMSFEYLRRNDSFTGPRVSKIY